MSTKIVFLKIVVDSVRFGMTNIGLSLTFGSVKTFDNRSVDEYIILSLVNFIIIIRFDIWMCYLLGLG